MVRSLVVFALLLIIKYLGKIFYSYKEEWIGKKPKDWKKVKIVAILNHTSLFDVLVAGFGKNSVLWRFARYGVLPVAEKTIKRKIIGLLFKLASREVIALTRKRDESWYRFIGKITNESLVAIMPEGRMKRKNGLDANGNPMTIRGGIADLLEVFSEGEMVIVYLGGMHHIQAPGEKIPRIFKKINARFQLVDIHQYKKEIFRRMEKEKKSFKQVVIEDFTRRRDTFCPPQE